MLKNVIRKFTKLSKTSPLLQKRVDHFSYEINDKERVNSRSDRQKKMDSRHFVESQTPKGNLHKTFEGSNVDVKECYDEMLKLIKDYSMSSRMFASNLLCEVRAGKMSEECSFRKVNSTF